MWDLGGLHKALGRTVERETEATKTNKSRKSRERHHLNSGTDNTKMVVLEACVIRRKAEPGGNSGVPLEEAVWIQYQKNGKG